MRRAAWFVCVLALGCDTKRDPAPKAARSGPPVGRIVKYACDVTGDYVEATVVAAAKAEEPAWQGCAQQVVTAPSDAEHLRMTAGTFQFKWELKDGQFVDDHLFTAGDATDCVSPIVTRLRMALTLALDAAGTLDCRVDFDDSLR